MLPNTHDFYLLSKECGTQLTECYNRYVAAYAECYTSGKGDDPTFYAAVSESNERKRAALAQAHKAMQHCLRSLKAANASLVNVWREPLGSGVCWWCDEAQGLSQYGGLCQSDYMFQYRNGYLPTDETLAKRYGWDES